MPRSEPRIPAMLGSVSSASTSAPACLGAFDLADTHINIDGFRYWPGLAPCGYMCRVSSSLSTLAYALSWLEWAKSATAFLPATRLFCTSPAALDCTSPGGIHLAMRNTPQW